MRKIISYTLSLAFLAAGMASCAKSTKGKVTNDWKVSSLTQEDRSTDQNGGKFFSTISMTGLTVQKNSAYTPVSGPVNVENIYGDIKTNTFSIKKDGTWVWDQELEYKEDDGINTRNTTQIMKQSGTWSFVGTTKGDDFKKNERILFHVLSGTTSTIEIENQSIVTENSETTTSLEGENMLIFRIDRSKNKKMMLELVENHSSTVNSSTSAEYKRLDITLIEE